MKYYNGGVLRTEQDSTLRLKLASRKQKLTMVEYLPLVILAVLMAGILIKSILG